MKSMLAHRVERTLITGGTGSLGTALIPKLLAAGQRVRVMSRDEQKQGALAREFPDVDCLLGDVRDLRACEKAVEGVSTVIHAASLKYVDRSEVEPTEYVLTNVLGSINMLTAVRASDTCHRMVGISTDKVPAAVNTYGLTKALMEKLFIEAALDHGFNAAVSLCRYGNVVGSRGSVLLVWQAARRAGRAIQVTNPAMTRFFFALDDAIDLIDRALRMTRSAGPVIVSKPMPAATLGDMAALYGGNVEIIGERPGEKRHEMLLTEEESHRTWLDASDGGAFYLYPRIASRGLGVIKTGAYTSDTAPRLEGETLRALLGSWL